MTRPFVKWAGGKTQLLMQLDKYLPNSLSKEDSFTYVEPFVGGGAMLFHMLQKYPNIDRAIINDINPVLITAYRVIKEKPELLIARLGQIQAEYRQLKGEEAQREYYLKTRESYNENPLGDIDKAAMFIFLNRTCFNGLHRVNSKGYFNVPFGRYVNPTICDEALIMEDSKALQKVVILCGDYTQVEFLADDKTFVYFDPPYRPLSATSSFTSYAKENFDDEEQIRLGQLFARLARRGCKVMLSNSDCSARNPNDRFFEELYADFIIERVYASRCINANPSKRGNLTELLIRSYEETASHVRQKRVAVEMELFNC